MTSTLSPSDIDQEIVNNANNPTTLTALLDAHDAHRSPTG